MRIFGSLVMKNEARRYLDDCLAWMRPFFDDLFIYDDRSTDDSVEIAVSHDAYVVRRGERSPSFLEDEGGFRWNAWQMFESTIHPIHGDWILAFDADEFLVHPTNVRAALENAIRNAQLHAQVGIILPFPEIFGIKDGVPQSRIDGYWGGIRGPRLFAYKQNALWSTKTMGCGSEPTYVAQGQLSESNMGLHMLHFGYARPEDKQEKYRRYSSLVMNGHADKHIQSIVETPILEPWIGPVPDWVTQ